MFTTMRAIAAQISASPGYSGELRLYISPRERESIYAISEVEQPDAPYSGDILYVMDWDILQSSLNGPLPQNLLCTNAPTLARPDMPKDHNVILLSRSITASQLRELLDRFGSDEHQATYAPQLLEALYSGSLDRLCQTAASLCGNPLIFVSFNFRVSAYSLLHSENWDVVRIAENGALGPEFVNMLHDRKVMARVTSGEVLTVPGSETRFLCVPILQGGIHMASILLFEDRVTIAQSDRQFLQHVAKCFRLLNPDINVSGPTRLIYEYALVRILSDEHASDGFHSARFSALGYEFKSRLRTLVISSGQRVNVDDLRHQLSTLTGQIRHVVGNHGICTSYRDHVVILLNMENDEPLDFILAQLRLLCLRDDLRMGISPPYSDAAQLKVNYRYALDAIGIGTTIHPDEVLYDFGDLRIYKFIATCSRSFSPTDLIPEYLERLIAYDHENNSNLLETLYYYVYTVRNTKKAAELMHVHRNTLLYRLEKIYSIIGMDPEEGDAFLQLMLSFKFLEFRARQEGRELCFKPIRTDGSTPWPEE